MNPVAISSSRVFKDPLRIYYMMFEDIEAAQSSIYLETYRFENDPIGVKFRNLLTAKAKAGVQVTLLLDAWGTSVSEKFFKELTDAGARVKFFKKVRLTINFLSANHERDHRKMLLIDDHVCYLSSINISNYNLNWREFSLRLTGEITKVFVSVFKRNYNLKNTYKFDKKRHTQLIRYEGFEIVRDVPSVRLQRIRKKLVQYIKKASEQIIIESPYFLPTRMMMDHLIRAAKRGVEVKVIMPQRSDVTVVNVLRQHYLGRLYEGGVKILYFQPTNLHAKVMIADDRFYVGSANFDYRSFRYQFEIGLFGDDQGVFENVRNYCLNTLEECIPFDYQEWKNRGLTNKLMEVLLLPVRHFL
ncbi:phosphatidylserine/phosphatidylglycerophosphate/cardiolipin synthase family protein, partial [Bacteroidota bacterium]